MLPRFEINGVNICIHKNKNKKYYIKGVYKKEDKKLYWKSDKINLKIIFKDSDYIKEYNFYPREIGLGNFGNGVCCDSIWWENKNFSGRFCKEKNNDLFYFTTLTFENSDILNFNNKILIQNPDNYIYIGE